MKTIAPIVLALMIGASSVRAQDGQFDISYDQLKDEHLDLSQAAWRFFDGELENGQDPLLDDSDWPLVYPELRADSSTTTLFDTFGWFRMHVTLDSTLFRNGFGMSIFHAGNAEMYWNGKLMFEAGRRGTHPNGGASITTTGVPTYVTAPDSAKGVIAVRFDTSTWSDQWQHTLDSRVRLSPGFAVVVGRTEAMAGTYGRRWIKENEFTFAMGVMLALSLLHLLMYRRKSDEVAHLYFGLSVLFMLPPIFLFGIGYVPASGAFYVSSEVTTIVWRYTLLVAQLLWLASVHSLLRDQLGRRYWVVFGILIAIPTLFDLGAPGLSVQRVVFGLAIVSAMDAILVTGNAIRKKQRDAIVLAFGFVGNLVGAQYFQVHMNVDFEVFRTTILEEVFFVSSRSASIWLYFLSTPIAMTVLLGKRYVESRVHLQETVDKRTEELSAALGNLKTTQAQLIQQEKMASLGSLTSGIAHEIKNPLNFVNNFADLANELTDELKEAVAEGDEEEIQALLDDISVNTVQIAKHGKRADSIVQAMMEHAGTSKSEASTVEVNDFVEEYINLAWHGASAKTDRLQARIERDFDEQVGQLSIMPQDMGRVIVNLLNNAFDAVEDVEEPRVRVMTRRDSQVVSISVSDNGPGIPEDIRDRIFEPFFTTKPTGEATGLGLSLSYDVVTKAHGGDIRVSENPDGGATFTVDLPSETV